MAILPEDEREFEMRIYEHSWDSRGNTVDIYVDGIVLSYLMEAVKREIKKAVDGNDFDKAKEHFKDLNVLNNKLEKLNELEKENENNSD